MVKIEQWAKKKGKKKKLTEHQKTMRDLKKLIPFELAVAKAYGKNISASQIAINKIPASAFQKLVVGRIKQFDVKLPKFKGLKQKLITRQDKHIKNNFERIEAESGKAEAHLFAKAIFEANAGEIIKEKGMGHLDKILGKLNLSVEKINNSKFDSKVYVNLARYLLPNSVSSEINTMKKMKKDALKRLNLKKTEVPKVEKQLDKIFDFDWKLFKKELRFPFFVLDIKNREDFVFAKERLKQMKSIFKKAKEGYKEELKAYYDSEIGTLKDHGYASRSGKPLPNKITKYYRELGNLRKKDKNKLMREISNSIINLRKSRYFSQEEYEMLIGKEGFNLIDKPSFSLQSALMRKKIVDVFTREVHRRAEKDNREQRESMLYR